MVKFEDHEIKVGRYSEFRNEVTSMSIYAMAVHMERKMCSQELLRGVLANEHVVPPVLYVWGALIPGESHNRLLRRASVEVVISVFICLSWDRCNMSFQMTEASRDVECEPLSVHSPFP